MGKLVRIWVDESLPPSLELIRREVAEDLKKRYSLDKVHINGNLISQILAAKIQKKKFIDFNIRKTGLNKGILELL